MRVSTAPQAVTRHTRAATQAATLCRRGMAVALALTLALALALALALTLTLARARAPTLALALALTLTRSRWRPPPRLWSRVRSCARNGLRFAQVYSGAYLRSLRERRVLWLTFCGRGGGGVGAGHVHSGVGMNRVEGSLGARPCQHETGCVREPWCGSVRGGARRVAAAGRHDLRARPRTSTGKRAGMSASVWG